MPKISSLGLMVVVAGISACGFGDVQEAVDETGAGTGDASADASSSQGEAGTATSDSTTTTTGAESTTTGDGDGDSTTDPTTTSSTTDASTTDASTTDPTTGGDGDATTDPTTSGDGDGDSGNDTNTTGNPNECTGGHLLQLDANLAQTSGDWVTVMSSISPIEGWVVFANAEPGTASGEARFDVELPCNDDWHVWVRALDSNGTDSFFAEIDGGPSPTPIFDIDCQGGDTAPEYKWVKLNAGDPQTCGLGNPWVPNAGAGIMELAISDREGGSISEVRVTNDGFYTP